MKTSIAVKKTRHIGRKALLSALAITGTVGIVSTVQASGCGYQCDNAYYTSRVYFSGGYHRCNDDARTVRTAFNGVLKLRYSPTCRTTWASVPSNFYYYYLDHSSYFDPAATGLRKRNYNQGGWMLNDAGFFNETCAATSNSGFHCTGLY
ncbi:MAG: DUF2690 domain-containing protein [Gammaproteobacteria bacterium]|nr:DUF2690 domain-containing protein [Gammaproteobacteria bacterium]